MTTAPLHPSPAPAPDATDATDGAEDPLAGLDFELTADERSRREAGRTCRFVAAACDRWLKARGLSEPMYQRRRQREGHSGERREPQALTGAGGG